MASCATWLSVLVLCCAVCPAWMIGLRFAAIIPTPTEKGVPQTAPPEQGLNKVDYAKPLYKDYYSKTLVIVTPIVSTVLYQDMDLDVLLNETWYTSTIDYNVWHNSTVQLRPSIMAATVANALRYDKFDWPTETQLYTSSVGTTTTNITTVVENTVPFL